jgi:IclR family acetate operon transcriptional repressor
MANDGDSATTAPVLVLRKIRRILEAFTIQRPELTLRQITGATGFPPSTSQRLVQNMVREGFLDRDGDSYRVGLGFVRWAAPGTFGLDLTRLVRPHLQRLRDDTGETACLYVRDGAHRTVIAMAESRHCVIRLFTVGMVLPLHAGSAGKAFLAWDPRARADAVRHGLARFTAHTIVDIDVLTEQLEGIRQAGHAISFEERDLGAASISAPVFGVSGDLVAVLGIGAPTQRLTPADVPGLAPLVARAAEQASHRLGYRPRRPPDGAAGRIRPSVD